MRISKTLVAKAATALGALVLASTGAHAAPVVDQANDVIGTVSFNGGAPTLTWQQGVVAGQTGQLTAIEVYFNAANLGAGIQFFVNQGAGWQSDANDFDAVLNGLVAGWNLIDVSSAGISLSAGDQLVFGFKGQSPGNFSPSFTGTSGDVYSQGQLFLNGAVYAVPDYDVNFRTYVEAGRLPEPGSAALVVIACLATGLARRRARA
ncbi:MULTISPECIES: hypothetical protein [unclassified Roseateles]|uniref:hypothetical protein n=1 Tax=Pelomonas sp. Root1237 TaxID=1736434 RepID=UPI000AD7C86C|nr:hypothetical protein [Pelomonas sp. Root1237]